jgi:hypothetical protein
MKKIISFFTLAVLLLLYSCTEDPLGLKEDNTWVDYYSWTDRGMAMAVLSKVYAGNPNLPDHYGNAFLDAATDNAIARNQTSTAWLAGNGGFSKSAVAIGNWSLCYNMFQYIHSFLENGLTDRTLYYRTDPAQDAAMKKRLAGEAHFLRAWWGFQLLQHFGGRADDGKAYGYPIVTEFIDKDNVNDPALFVRNTYEECVQQILDDCQAAFDSLPLYWAGEGAIDGLANIGRGSGIAAYLLRSRVALYAASPAYQDNTVVRIDDMGEFTVLDQAACDKKWERAAAMAKQAMDLTGFGAYTFKDATKFSNSALAEDNEFVFRYRTSGNRNLENRHAPPSNFGQALTQPSHNLYMACAVANGGYPLSDPASGYDDDAPYALTMDKRAANLLYHHGDAMGGQAGYFDLADGNRDTPVYSPDATITGYYLRKFILPTVVANYVTPGANSQRVNPYLRRSEAFFNYAEAMNELYGPTLTGASTEWGTVTMDVTAQTQMADIRKKAGITTDTYLAGCAADKNLMRTLIHNERRLEFAFENHYFFDIRRWLHRLDTPVQAMTIIRTSNGEYNYYVSDVEQRPMSEIKYYFPPLPEAETQKGVKNNFGWD